MGISAILAVIAFWKRVFNSSAKVLALGALYFGSRAWYACSKDNTRSGIG